MSFSRRYLLGFGAALAAPAISATAHADAKKVVVGYQTDALPSSLAIANGEFARATGTEIDFRRFNSGAEIFAAIASGDVQIGYVGSEVSTSRPSISLRFPALTKRSLRATALG
jgi:taurine transport system substrate-binding protein